MLRIRPADERGHADHGWLDSWFSFSFAEYHDPQHMGFRSLRVINEDRVAPSRGFPKHPHRDMEIITYVLEGELAHEDSMGNGSVIRPGDVQRMSAGSGVVHSEQNPSAEDSTHLLQIWILPSSTGGPPGYEQKHFPVEERRGRLRVVGSPDGRDGSVTIGQDAMLLAGILDAGERAHHELAPGRHAWVQVARGSVDVNGTALSAGDGLAVSDEATLELHATGDAELLLFDLA